MLFIYVLIISEQISKFFVVFSNVSFVVTWYRTVTGFSTFHVLMFAE